MGIIRVLVVDDESVTHETLKSALPPDRYEIVEARSGEEGLLKAQGSTPDLIVLDVALPGMDGLTLLKLLRAQPEFALVPVILLTAQSSAEDRIRGFRLGADDFLPKPVHPEELELRMERVMRRREKTETSFRTRAGGEKKSAGQTEMLAAFKGSLEEIGLPSLLSLLEGERKTGTLVVTLEPTEAKARLYLREGRILRAQADNSPDLKNADLIYFLLRRSRGKFHFRPEPVKGGDEIESPTVRLLLEGARLIDEGVPEEGAAPLSGDETR